MFNFPATYIALWVVAVFQGLLVIALLRELAQLRQFAELGSFSGKIRLPIGSSAPEISDVDQGSRQQVRIADHLGDRGGIILFLSLACPACKDLVDSMGPIAGDDLPPLLAICRGGEQACAKLLSRLKFSVRIVVDSTGEVAGRYGISATPTAVVVDSQQKIRAYAHPRDSEDLKRFFSRTFEPEKGSAAWTLEVPETVLRLENLK